MRLVTHSYTFMNGVIDAHYKLNNIKRKDYTI